MNNFIRGLLIALVTVAIYTLLLIFPVMLIWNAIMPELFGFKDITFWQSAGIIFMGQAIFSSQVKSKS